MQINGSVAVVTGGASGLGRATAEYLSQRGAKVVITDLASSPGAAGAEDITGEVLFVPADVRSEPAMRAVFDAAEQLGPVRIAVNCAGRGGALRVLDKEGRAGSLEAYEAVVQTNLVGSFNVLRLAAERMARTDPIEGERGVVVMTASIAAYEGQIGQMPYASSKAGVVGMTIVAARDLATRQIRVCTIAPGLFDTPLLRRLPPEAFAALSKSVPHPSRLGSAHEYASLVEHIISNSMINGETIRLDGALRMQAR
jgi:NAD(P)-dependent dehydrogenase (short-subunit alcohol dehydrogenase family)